MKIVLVTCGSRGDVQPMIALSLALKAAGHDVLLAGPPEKAEWAGHLGCPYLAFGKDVTAFIDRLENAINLRAALGFISFVRQELNFQFKHLPGIIKKADCVIGSSLVFGLSSIAEALHLRYRYIAFTPQIFPSGAHPFLTIKTQTLPQWANRISWHLAEFLDKFNLTFLINDNRKKIGLKTIDNAWDHILGDHTIVASDREIATVPLDVKKTVVQTGYLHLDLPGTEQPDLDRFLEKGARPIYAGFGSMPPKDQEKITPLLIRAARNVGKRVVITKFCGTVSEDPSSSDVFYIRNYPHLRLFPRTDAIIHHGGAGTTASSALSGIPQAIVPHILDQYYHGQKIYLSGLGPEPIWRSNLTEGKLTAALEECLFNAKMKQTARKTGKLINPDLSLQMTVTAIEHAY